MFTATMPPKAPEQASIFHGDQASVIIISDIPAKSAKIPQRQNTSEHPRHHATTPPRHHATTPPRHPVALRHFNTQKIAALPTHPKRPSVFDSFVYVYYAYVDSVAPTSLHSRTSIRYERSTSGGFGLTGEGRA